MRKINRRNTPAGILFLLLIMLAFTGVARAQVPSRHRIAVLEMTVLSPSDASRLSGRDAAEIVSVVLKQQGNEVAPRKDVEQAIKDFDFYLPLSPSEMQVLGKRVKVERVVSGKITEISFTEKPRQATVYFSLSVTDTITGDYLDLGLTKGRSLPDAGTSSDAEQIKAAIQNAADRFPPTIASLSMPIATISGVGGEVALNRGSRDGLHVGDEADVYRGGNPIARLRLSGVEDTESVGYFPEGGRLPRPEDRALFLPPKPPKAAVLEVLIRPQNSSLIPSQKATDILADAVAGEGGYTVMPRNDVEGMIKYLHYSVPPNQNEKQQLGMILGVNKFVLGEVTEVTFTDKPRRAHVTLSLSLFDVVAGELVYKTLKTGDSSKARGTDAELIEKAVKKAAEAVFNPSPVIRTAVMTFHGPEIRLNRGSNDGIRLGDEAIQIHSNQRRRRIRINSVSVTESTAISYDYSGPSGDGDTVIFVIRQDK